jgi:hypothetical protein
MHGDGPGAKAPSPSRESSYANRYVFFSFFIVAFRVTRVAAFLELFAAFVAAGFLGETFFATRFTSSHISSSELHRHPIARS